VPVQARRTLNSWRNGYEPEIFVRSDRFHRLARFRHWQSGDGTQVTVTSGQPPKDPYVPAPSFEQLDSNHDGFISREEAEAYLPLLNDYDNLLTEYHHPKAISKRQFDTWNRAENHQ
jgi:hypothetical protein